MSNIHISIIVPLYNEEKNIDLLYYSITKVMKNIDKRYEIIFIDDGSIDKTFEKSQSLHKKDPCLKIIKFQKNYGQTPAMQAGFDFAKGEIVISMDGDLQNDPADIPGFLKKIEEGYDIVCGWRKNRHDEWLRVFLSKIANRLISKIAGVKIHDNGCSLKAYKKEVLQKTRLYSEMHRFIPAMASISGIRYTEIIVNHRKREFGTSKYGMSRVWKVFLDLFLIKMLVDFSTRPGHWFSILSLPFLILGVLFVGLYLNVFPTFDGNGTSFMIFPSVATLFFFLFAHLFFLGMLGEIILLTGDFNLKSGNNLPRKNTKYHRIKCDKKEELNLKSKDIK